MPEEVRKRKQELRKQFSDAREQLSREEAEEKSTGIMRKIFELPEYISAGTVHIYVPMKGRNEVNTMLCIENSLKLGKKVMVPKMAPGGLLKHAVISSVAELKPNRLGIPEPRDGVPSEEVSGIDLVFVPMVAGDKTGNRLGSGKGYYDRFLKIVPTCKIGILFDCQLSVSLLPAEEFDVKLDILITESRVIR